LSVINKSSNHNGLKEILAKNYVPILFCILYTAIFSIATILRYQTFNASILDLGVEMHTIWLISIGHFNFFQNNHASLLSGYFEILYIPLGFIYKLIPHVSFFLVLQSFLIGISAFPFYYISRDILGKKWGFIGPLLILLNPQIHTGNIFDFHISVFYVTFISFALYFALKKRLFYLYLFSFLVLITKVDSFLYVTSIAIFMCLIGFKKKHIIILISAGWIYGLFTLFYILPHLQPHLTERWGGGMGHSGYPILIDGIEYIKKGDVTGFILVAVNTLLVNIKYNFRFLLYLLAALGFMPLFAKKYTAVVFLPLLVCWLAGFYPGHFYYYEPFLFLQYSYFLVPFFVLAAIYGLKNTINLLDKTDFKFVKKYFIVIFVSLLILLTVLIQSYSSISNYDIFNVFNLENYKYKQNMHPNDLKKAFRRIKSKYWISSSNFVGSQLYNHYVIKIFPAGIKSADYIVFSSCRFIPYNKIRDIRLLNKFDSLKDSGKYNVVYKKGCNTILKLK